jgi:hypothetical protein
MPKAKPPGSPKALFNHYYSDTDPFDPSWYANVGSYGKNCGDPSFIPIRVWWQIAHTLSELFLHLTI